MSRKHAFLTGLLGAAVGAVVGAPYLAHAGDCAGGAGPQLQCTMNTALGPFISAIAIGFVVTIALRHIVLTMVRRLAGPAPKEQPGNRAAVDIADPVLQIAAWGLPPHSPRRVLETSLADGEAVDTLEQPSPQEHPATPEWRTDPPIVPPSGARQDGWGGLGTRGRPVPTPRQTI